MAPQVADTTLFAFSIVTASRAVPQRGRRRRIGSRSNTALEASGSESARTRATRFRARLHRDNHARLRITRLAVARAVVSAVQAPQMAERALPAFGRYVKMLRERRGLSLDDAASLTRVYPSPLNKGYVSRVERGLTRVGFEKMIAIARAYDVAVDVLAERLWLDLELDTTNPPDTGGDQLSEMIALAARAAGRGLLWHCYAYMRDALPLGLEGPVVPRFSGRQEQVAICCTDIGAAAMKLGALRFALHEMKYARGLLATNSTHAAMVAIHLANLSRRLGDLTAAQRYAEESIAMATQEDSRRYAGYGLTAKGMIEHERGQFSAALADYQNAISAFRSVGQDSECATVLVNIAEAYFESNRMAAAKRSLASAEKTAREFAIDHVRVRARILRGELSEAEGNHDDALRLWREAADLARHSRDRTLLFKADFLIYRRAIASGQTDLARALAKKLSRISPWVMPEIPELREFHSLTADHPEILRRQRRVVK